MSKPFINLLHLASFIAASIFSAQCLAGKDDFNQKIELSSLYQQADGIAKKAFHEGNVVIKQGTLELKADELEIDASAGDGKEIFIAKGKPAQYSQQQEDGSIVTAKANRIEYQRETRALSLSGGAEIEQNASSVKGESIVFNMELEQIIAQGDEKGSVPVITTFQPVTKEKTKTKKQQDKQP
ncbi:lipopolysaccharide transport periplasmic protein LptA [Paraglaciecola marina]|uniref:lipopolysaccharide transport periplasmic protein LptA n=1 Tax=Paraglaciecola marina TaxID=2500157 RepID=UPI00105EFC3B|nr:lipopolysaccharide transport periplasmic protein LptA [Paraglaciecola marina]